MQRLILILALTLHSISCSNDTGSSVVSEIPDFGQTVLKPRTLNDFKRLVNSGRTAFVLITMDYCLPCMKLKGMQDGIDIRTLVLRESLKIYNENNYTSRMLFLNIEINMTTLLEESENFSEVLDYFSKKLLPGAPHMTVWKDGNPLYVYDKKSAKTIINDMVVANTFEKSRSYQRFLSYKAERRNDGEHQVLVKQR